jgi:ribosomal protein S25
MEEEQFTPARLSELFKPSVEYRILSSSELDEGYFDQQYAITDLMVEGQTMIVAGGRKSLKTTIAIAMAIALATGTSLLGHFPVRRRYRVAIMSGESGISTLQETARRICHSVGVCLSEIDNLFWTADLPRFGDQSHLLAMHRFLTEKSVEMLFIDPVYLAMPATEPGNLFQQGLLLSGITELCQSLGITLVLLHHLRKNRGPAQSPPELDEIAWSGFAEWCRQWCLLGRRETYTPGTGKHQLWLSAGGSAGHSGLFAVDIEEGKYDGKTPRYWQVSIASGAQANEQNRAARAQSRLEKAKERLLDAARQNPGKTISVLKEQASLSGTIARKALDQLLASGIVRVKKDKNKNLVFLENA